MTPPREQDNRPGPEQPDISVVILNYNGARWLERCFASLADQTLAGRFEVIVADNASTDGSDRTAEEDVKARFGDRGRFLSNGGNLGFCEGNNRGADLACGRYLFFLNNDTWLETDCLERLLSETERMDADAATPLMLNYEDDSVQSAGGAGFDAFGLMSLAPARTPVGTREIFVCGGCSFLIRRDLFQTLGGFDSTFFMYADEYDLSWRVWLSGARAVIVPSARLHHRGAANVNPEGDGRIITVRTSDSKRFHTNRNNLLVVLKNTRWLWTVMLPLQLLLLAAEGTVWSILQRRPSFLRRAYLDAVTDVVRLRGHWLAERRRLRALRRRGDVRMLRFLRWRPNRWDDIAGVLRHGLPRVDRR